MIIAGDTKCGNHYTFEGCDAILLRARLPFSLREVYDDKVPFVVLASGNIILVNLLEPMTLIISK